MAKVVASCENHQSRVSIFFRVSAQPLAVEVYLPQEGGQFDQRETSLESEKKIKYIVGAASSRDEPDLANPIIVAGLCIKPAYQARSGTDIAERKIHHYGYKDMFGHLNTDIPYHLFRRNVLIAMERAKRISETAKK